MTQHLVEAVIKLDPQPRRARWTSLSYCVLDAVWSIGAHYDNVVVPLVRGVAAAEGDQQPTVTPPLAPGPDPLPLPVFLERYPDEEMLKKPTNAQRTSTRHGITKAEATLQYARILVDHKVTTLDEAAHLLGGAEGRFALVDRALAEVAGDGQHGVRRGYLWMLCGNDHLIKPDRMVLRWLARHRIVADPAEARRLLDEVAVTVSERLGRTVTPWMVDHAIWQRSRAASTGGRNRSQGSAPGQSGPAVPPQ